MAVLTPDRGFPGADRVLAAHGAALPQPDQLCGPFSAGMALHAVLDDPSSVVDLAVAAGTAVWPHDVAAWRPEGAPLDRTGWELLSRARSAGESGTTGDALAAGVARVTGVAVVAVRARGRDATVGGVGALLADLVGAAYRVGVVAHVRTGPMEPGAGWDVGHFVVLWVWAGGRVGVADTYREMGTVGSPPGCREVSVDALVAGLTAPPGRGLLLLVRAVDADRAAADVRAAGLVVAGWGT